MAKKLKTRTFTETQKQRLIEEYAVCKSPIRAFNRAGIPESHPTAAFHELCESESFKSNLATAVALIDEQKDVANDLITRELASVAFCDISDFYDDEGKLIPIKELPPHARAAIKGVKTIKVRAGEDCDDVIVDGYEVWDKLNALQMLGKSSKNRYFTEVVENNLNVELSYRPDSELVSRFAELVRKAGGPAISGGNKTAGDDAKIVDVLPGDGALS